MKDFVVYAVTVLMFLIVAAAWFGEGRNVGYLEGWTQGIQDQRMMFCPENNPAPPQRIHWYVPEQKRRLVI